MRATRFGGVLFAIAALVLPGCSGEGDNARPSGSSVTLPDEIRQTASALSALAGVWTGDWRQVPGGEEAGTLRIEWQQTGRVMRGSIALSGTSCVAGSNVTGALAENRIGFEAIVPPDKVTFIGTVTGDSMSGTYTMTCGEAQGVWEARKA